MGLDSELHGFRMDATSKQHPAGDRWDFFSFPAKAQQQLQQQGGNCQSLMRTTSYQDRGRTLTTPRRKTATGLHTRAEDGQGFLMLCASVLEAEDPCLYQRDIDSALRRSREHSVPPFPHYSDSVLSVSHRNLGAPKGVRVPIIMISTPPFTTIAQLPGFTPRDCLKAATVTLSKISASAKSMRSRYDWWFSQSEPLRGCAGDALAIHTKSVLQGS